MIIQAKDIWKSFGELKVLKGIDFEVEKSEVVSIVGASGAGKTTFLEILGTLSSPDSGSLVIGGQDVLAMKRTDLSVFRGSHIGFVFQFHHLLPEFTSLENVMIPALIAKNGKKEAAAKAEELLESVGLADRTHHKPSELSGGEQQRVAIARALVNSPSVLLADEPTGNLDSVTKEEIHRLFLSVRDNFGQTIVIITHDNELANICDKKYTMKDGLFV